jgi:hypothetical protein
MAWWQDRCEPSSVFDAYRAYIASVRGSLPRPVYEFLDAHTLHDAEVRELSVDLPGQRARLLADGYDARLDKSVHYALEYSRITTFTLLASHGEVLPGPAGLGHLGYDEFELLAGGRFEHRLLFSTGVEVVVNFGAFSFSATPPGHTVIAQAPD